MLWVLIYYICFGTLRLLVSNEMSKMFTLLSMRATEVYAT